MQNICYHVAAFAIPFNLICNMIFFFFLYTLPDPLSSIIGRCTLYTSGSDHVLQKLNLTF